MVIIAAAIFLFGGSVVPAIAGLDSSSDLIINKNTIPSNIGEDGNILYVGGSGPGNYTTIQEAIGDATAGDTVFVYSGTYSENVNIPIPKRISVIGEDKNTTIIEGIGGDAVVSILMTDVVFEGFTVQGDSSGQDGIQVVTLMQDILINDNIIQDCAYGIWLPAATERITITSNHIRNNEYAGIRLGESDKNDIIGNIVEDNGDWGISLQALSKINNIAENTITGNNGGINIAGASEENEIVNNTISNNDLEGLLIEGLSTGNNIVGNDINNNFAGIKLSVSGQNIINKNNLESNTMEGLLLESSNSNIITQNNFIDNQRQAKYRLSSRNSWDENYWDNWIGLKLELPIFKSFPKLIGGLGTINLDRNPASEPYEI